MDKKISIFFAKNKKISGFRNDHSCPNANLGPSLETKMTCMSFQSESVLP